MTSLHYALPKLFDISHGILPWRESGDFDSLQTNVRITTIDSRLHNLWNGLKKVWFATPTMHGDEMKYITEAYETNWMSTIEKNINEVERIAAEKAEMKYVVDLSCRTAALHLAVKHVGETLYGKPAISHGALEGKRVFCLDMTFDATLNPVVYEGGIPVFIDMEADSWNMDSFALEKAF